MDELAHLVITINELGRKGTAWPERLPGSEYYTGYVLTAGTRKLWIKGYCTERVKPTNEINKNPYQVEEDIFLGIPSVEQRFNSKILRE